MLDKYKKLLQENKEAVCFSNFKGRLLNGNKKFCKMFGFKVEDVPWHFLEDLHRHKDDWNSLTDCVEQFGSVDHYYSRLRNRSGRSFHCLISRHRIDNGDGRYIYASVVKKITSAKAKEAGIMKTPRQSVSGKAPKFGGLVYLTSCAHCNKVQDSSGNWIELKDPNTVVKHNRNSFCQSCAKKLYPEFVEYDKKLYEEIAL